MILRVLYMYIYIYIYIYVCFFRCDLYSVLSAPIRPSGVNLLCQLSWVCRGGLGTFLVDLSPVNWKCWEVLHVDLWYCALHRHRLFPISELCFFRQLLNRSEKKNSKGSPSQGHSHLLHHLKGAWVRTWPRFWRSKAVTVPKAIKMCKYYWSFFLNNQQIKMDAILKWRKNVTHVCCYKYIYIFKYIYIYIRNPKQPD